MPHEPILLIFDGTCSFCTRCARLAVERSPRGRLSALPSQTPGLLERHGITSQQAERWVWAVTPAGRWHGAAAAAQALDAMGGGWRGLALLARLPGAGLVYAAVARGRGRLGAAWGDPPPCGR